MLRDRGSLSPNFIFQSSYGSVYKVASADRDVTPSAPHHFAQLMKSLSLARGIAWSLLFLRNDLFESVEARGVPHPRVFERMRRDHPSTRTLLLDPTCQQIQAAMSSASAVYAPGSLEYTAQIGEQILALRISRSVTDGCFNGHFVPGFHTDRSLVWLVRRIRRVFCRARHRG